MLIKDLLPVIQGDEMICIQTKEYEVLEINERCHLTAKYLDKEVKLVYGERYPAYSTIGTTITI